MILCLCNIRVIPAFIDYPYLHVYVFKKVKILDLTHWQIREMTDYLSQAHKQRGCDRTLLAGQIISNSCSFSSEIWKFTHRYLGPVLSRVMVPIDLLHFFFLYFSIVGHTRNWRTSSRTHRKHLKIIYIHLAKLPTTPILNCSNLVITNHLRTIFICKPFQEFHLKLP